MSDYNPDFWKRFYKNLIRMGATKEQAKRGADAMMAQMEKEGKK